MIIFGAICPARRVAGAMITPAANTEMMNLHLAEISTQVAAGSIAASMAIIHHLAARDKV